MDSRQHPLLFVFSLDRRQLQLTYVPDPTDNLEYYDPRGAFTQGGALVLNMTKQNPATNNGFSYGSGMLQGWNQFCFTGGYVEVAINLPGRPDVEGFWRRSTLMRKSNRY